MLARVNMCFHKAFLTMENICCPMLVGHCVWNRTLTATHCWTETRFYSSAKRISLFMREVWKVKSPDWNHLQSHGRRWYKNFNINTVLGFSASVTMTYANRKLMGRERLYCLILLKLAMPDTKWASLKIIIYVNWYFSFSWQVLVDFRPLK